MTEQISKIFENTARPSDFMRARRPELFSDSTAYDEALYPRSVFDYFLDTLTSRNEERLFETFARRLAERVICPNLVPQTGPVGGGDSKVDSETYPVAEELASTWYHNDAVAAAREKWAFAISAKRAWRPKVQSDVRKIAATGRGYTNIYFITNQYVPDKARGELQDSLSSECNAKVTILDRTWILAQTYENRHLDLAFEVFSIVPDYQQRVRQGPVDAMRQKELTDLDARIADVASYRGSTYRRAEDALEAALLSRSLGRPSLEVDGRFARAIEMVEGSSGSPPLLRFKYLQAWTRYWWFDDAEGTARLYDGIFAEAKIGSNAWQLERVLNLWFCLLSASRRGALSPEMARLEARAKELEESLLAAQRLDAGSTNSLFARTQLVFLRLATRLPHGQIDDLLAELRGVVKLAGNHIDFPMDSLSQMLQELETILDDADGLDDVLELVFSATEGRASNEASAGILIERAERKLRSNKPYDAISLLGRGLVRLQSTEARREMLVAMALLGAAYERVGLLWAARGMLLFALDRGLRPLREDGVLPEICASLMRRLCWIELQLGRPTRIFRSVEVANLYQGILGKGAKASQTLHEEGILFNSIFGILILRTPFAELASLQFLPSVLSHPRLNLPVSRTAALFALGYDDAVVYESGIPKEELYSFFAQLANQPAADDLPDAPLWHLGGKATYRTSILGCVIELEINPDEASVVFAELLLAAAEAYAATAQRAGIYPLKSLIRCRATPSDGSAKIFSSQLTEDDCGEPFIQIKFNTELVASRDALAANTNEYFELIAQIVHTGLMPTTQESIEQLVGPDGEALTRTVFFQGLAIVDDIVFGDKSRPRIEDWVQYLDVKESFQVIRANAWDANNAKREQRAAAKDKGESGELSGQDGLKHSQIFVSDVINATLWDRAGWQGTLVQGEQNGTFVIGLIFKDIEAGKKIFRGLRKKLGTVDADDLLQITLLTGISANAPRDYRVVLAPNPNLLMRSSKGKAAFMLTRINTMNTNNTVMVDAAKQIQSQGQGFYLAPAFIEASGPRIFLDVSIKKSSMQVTPGWTIDENSPLMAALLLDDDVLIPGDVVDPPIKRALSKLRSFGR